MTFAFAKHYIDFLPRFYRLSFVAVLSNMMVPLAGLCDTAFLGHLQDIKPLAGVILASILFDYLYRILKFLRNSTNAMAAQASGENDSKGVILAGLRSSLIAIAIAFIILSLQYPIQKLGFAILSGSPEIEVSGIEYFNARIWGAPAVLLNFVLIGWFLGKEKNSFVLLISLIANGSNVLFDYLMIYRWGWDSVGAGLATALSQYLALFVALIGVAFSINWQDFSKAIPEVLDKQALQGTISLKFNILVRFLALISAYSIFTNLSARMGTDLLTENGLLLQIALLSQFTIQGVGMTTQTLIGNFKGQKEFTQMLPLLITSILTSLIIALGFAFSTIFFPQPIFSLLTNHSEINQGIVQYTIWLLPLLSFTAIAFMLEGYFIGLKEGAVLRNASLIAFFMAFIPLVILATYFDSVDLLWLSLTSYMFTLILVLVTQISRTQDALEFT
ncbi:MATE efflux family protein [Hyella patelloides LEGE 07179]|uniref:Probable multidrug resistance protein NorM n=1 Tax=Hyella patelloides LEGE 07179 TaxID=945734 RepID=A0A563VIN9_9CYAN|nr:guanitoxin biosynthesis MATE family efflux transporter GntT [Hyella patelloides]VEP11290.1 MATE efflux family protein [Hyella patelloides LEGE 07179]